MTDAIAAFDWDLDGVKGLHQALNKAMKQEVEHLVALGGARPATEPPPARPAPEKAETVS